MNYIQNWQSVRDRYLAAWALENHDRPLISVMAPKGPMIPPEDMPKTVQDRWLDFDRVIRNARRQMDNTYFAAEGLPIYNPNLGPDIFGAILGCDITFGPDTSWCNHPVSDWKSFNPVYDPANLWLQRIISLTEMAVTESRGDFMVGITDIHPGMDALVSLRGPQELCMDIYDYPEDIVQLPMRLFEIMKRFYNDLEAITSKNQKGTTNWMGIWHPKRWSVTSCDFNCMVSNSVFREYILPELLAELDFFDASIYHLDGPEALRHLDDLLSVKELNGIQWVPGSGQQPMEHWKDVLVKCQQAGKMLFLNCGPESLEPLSEFLQPEGVIISLGYVPDPQQADAIVKQADALWRKKQIR